MSIKRPVQQLSVLASALALSFSMYATSAAANDVVTVVDPSPVNWFWVTWNTMEETVRVDSNGRSTPSQKRLTTHHFLAPIISAKKLLYALIICI